MYMSAIVLLLYFTLIKICNSYNNMYIIRGNYHLLTFLIYLVRHNITTDPSWMMMRIIITQHITILLQMVSSYIIDYRNGFMVKTFSCISSCDH